MAVKYMIKFLYIDGSPPEIYSGGTYIFNGEKYACFNNNNPKVYKSKQLAERSAKKLSLSCSNTEAYHYEIIEVECENNG